MGTDVVLHDTLIFDGETFDPALSVGITANLVSSLGKRTALEVEVADGGLIIYVPWVERNAGYYGLEVTGSCNSKKWATYADSLIHYTRATEIGVAEVTIESDYYDITQVVAYRYSTSPINSVIASVDNEVGTPGVDIDYNGKNLSFAFHNLKGEPFTYDDLTPQQKAELKGEQGDSAVFDPTDPNPPDFEMANSKGQSTTKAMTQKAVTDALQQIEVWGGSTVDLEDSAKPWISDNVWKSESGDGNGSCTRIEGGKTYKIIGHSVYSTNYAFLLDIDNRTEYGQQPHYATGYSNVIYINANAEIYIVAPENATYIYFRRYKKVDGSRVRCLPSLEKMELTKEHIDGIEDSVVEVREEITDVKEDMIYSLTSIPIPTGGTYISGTTWHSATIYANGVVLEVTQGRTYRIVLNPNVNASTNYAWLEDNNRTGNVKFAPNCSLVTIPKYSTVDITAPDGANYLYLRKLCNIDDEGNGKYPISRVSLITTIKEYLNGDGEGNDETTMLIKHATIKPPASGNLPYFNLLHYSDIHGSTVASKGILDAIRKYGGYVDEVLNTGDVIYSVVGSSTGNITWWNNCGLKLKSLFTPGNHDDLINNNTREREGKAYLHNNYFTAAAIDELGYIMPDGYDDENSPNYKACYWHKDYADQKVRLIGLDCMDKCDGVVNPANGAITTQGTTGNEQEVWLCERLAETLPDSGNDAEGYTVVICGHYPLDGYDIQTYGENKEWDDTAHEWVCNHKSTGGRVINQKTGEVSNWHRYVKVDMVQAATMRWSNAQGVNNIGNIIEYYIGEGINFAAFICGHTHNNLLFYPKKYPNILNVCIDMAGNLRDMYYADQGTMGGFIANVVSFNTSANLLKIVRLGVKSDYMLTPIKYLCYDYNNRKVIQEG